MKVVQPSAVPAEPATSSLFTGEVSRQPIVTPEMSQNFNVGIVNFPAGVRNKMHTHSSAPVLFVTEGTGIIATETTQQGPVKRSL
jgi:quercetin dioxygenase-like cupin family protein